MQNYYNSLTMKKKNMMGAGDYITGLTTPTSTYQLNDVVGCEEISSTHPYEYVATDTNSTLAAKLDVDPYPRAIMSKVWSYNMEHNLPPNATGTAGEKAAALLRAGCGYFAGTLDPLGGPGIPYNFGGVPMGTGSGAGGSGEATVAYTYNFPALPMCVTPSVA